MYNRYIEECILCFGALQSAARSAHQLLTKLKLISNQCAKFVLLPRIYFARCEMSFDGINIPQKLVPGNYLQLGLAAQRQTQRNFKELLEKVINRE